VTPQAGEQIEHEWTDRMGTHWRVEQRGADGRLHGQTITRLSYFGWPLNPSRDDARAAVARAALSPKDQPL
jgi:hypothetical protein